MRKKFIFKKTFYLSIFLLFFSACNSQQDVDDFFGFNEKEIVEVPVPGGDLSISINYPAVDDKKVGYQAKISGVCGWVGKPVEIEGGAIGYSVCDSTNTWEAIIDFSAAPIGPVDVEVYLVDGDDRSTPAERRFVKDSADCDTVAQRSDIFGNFSTGGDGGATPYSICNEVQLSHVSSYATSNFILRNDIDLDGSIFSGLTITYRGVFDGNDFTIENFTLNKPTTDNVGLFSYLNDTGVIQNLILSDISITGRNQVGGLLGRLRGEGRVLNCSVSGTMEGNNNVGGVIGYIDSVTGNLEVSDISAELQISANQSVAGIIGGANNTTYNLLMNNCNFTGDISVAASYAGGLVGYNYSDDLDIQNSSVEGSITVNNGSYIGGIIGFGRGADISNSYYEGDIVSFGTRNDTVVGGLVGQLYLNATISNSWAEGDITAYGGRVGGIAGRFYGPSMDTVYHLGDISAVSEVAVNTAHYVGGIAGSFQGASNLTIIDTFHEGDITVSGDNLANYTAGFAGQIAAETFSITNSYAIADVSNSTPASYDIAGFVGALSSSAGGGASLISSCYAQGDVIGPDTYQLGGLIAVASMSGTEIDINNSYYSGNVSTSRTANQVAAGFIGQFQLNAIAAPGVQASISNCYSIGTVTSSLASYTGGFLGYGYVRGEADLTINNSYTTTDLTLESASSNYVGGFIGRINAEANTTVAISNASATSNVLGALNYLAGFMGYYNGGTSNMLSISSSHATGNIRGEGSYLAGFIGYLTGGTSSSVSISNSYAEGQVEAISGTSRSGIAGFLGYIYTTTDSNMLLNNIRAFGNVIANNDNYVGGLIGYQYVNAGDVAQPSSHVISNSYATGTVSGGRESTGGLIGYSRTYNYSDSQITDSYATGSVSSLYRYTGGLVGYLYVRPTSTASLTRTYATGDVLATDNNNHGGLIGYANDNATVTDSYATGSVTGATCHYLGGLVGYAGDINISNSYSTGDISGAGQYYGGIVGTAGSSVINACFTTGDVDSSHINGRVGGIVGNFSGTLKNCFVTGNIEGMQYVGGIAGYYNVAAPAPDPYMDYVYFTGNVTKKNGSTYADNRFGPIFGRIDTDAGMELYYNTDFDVIDGASGLPLAGANTQGTGLDSDQMKVSGNFVGFDFAGSDDEDWKMPGPSYFIPGVATPYEYPVLQWLP